MQRDVLFHCHFFKNAGSSIDWALRRSFGKGFYENKEVFPILKWNNYLKELLLNKKIKVLSSHIFSLKPPELTETKLHLIALYRHPIERVTSVAANEKRQNYRHSLGTITNADIDIRGYVKAYLTAGTPASIRNMHTLRFAGRDNGTPISEEDFAKAVETLEQCKTIGLVEAFDKSMVLFEEHLKPIFPDLDLAYVPQNVMQAKQSTEQRLERLKSKLGEELFEILCKKNEMDLKLYKIVKTHFQERLNHITNFNDKLDAFRARCNNLDR